MKKFLAILLAMLLALSVAGMALAQTDTRSLEDNEALTLGYNDDAWLYHTGANSIWNEKTGNIYLQSDGTTILDVDALGVAVTGTLTSSGALTTTSGGHTITAGGLTVTAGGITVTAGGQTITAGNLALVAGSATFKDTYGIVLGTGSDVAIVYDGTNVTFSGTGGLQFKNNTADSSPALIMGSGTAALPATTAVAGKNFLEFRTESTATSGDSRAMYLRHYLAGAGASGDALRAFATIEAAIDTASGAHISTNFGASGSVSGLAAAARTTLHVPNSALAAAGTYTALQGEIYSDGSSADPSAVTELAALRLANSGDGTGKGRVDDKAAIISLTGWGDGTGNAVYTHNPGNTFSGSIKILVNGVVKYLYFADSE